tara:strand:- start:911 stop:1564 length:654 start_codon:yes stop_codon:yes gene_type:complete
MVIHKEGRKTILVSFLILTFINFFTFYLSVSFSLFYGILALSLFIFLFLVQFFRSPNIKISPNEDILYSPAEGKIVIIDNVFEDEYFKANKLQVSIFMSPLNVHVNRNPISGEVDYYKYHPGKYLLAWHPKSSKLNERNTIVIKSKKNIKILMRQIAGTVARRIKCYIKKGQKVNQCEEFGFIKFGSRVDLFLPLDFKLNIKLGDKTHAGITKIGKF